MNFYSIQKLNEGNFTSTNRHACSRYGNWFSSCQMKWYCFYAVLFSGCLRHLRFLPIVYSCWHVQITVGNVSGMFVIFIKLHGSPDECFFLIDKTKCKHNKYFCLICESKCSWKGYPLEPKKINKQQNFSNYYMSCV